MPNTRRSEVRERPVVIEATDLELAGDLTLPAAPKGVVLFAHGSGSSRHSSRNRAVAGVLVSAGFATLLLDLLTLREDERERAGGMLRFDVELLATRLGAAIEWLGQETDTQALPIGLFGASTGAASALITAALHPERVRAVVSRGGRPDLAALRLPHVQAPTLLIVGGADPVVLDMNRRALALLCCTKDLVVVPGATHLFEERGALEEVARLARGWFQAHLSDRTTSAAGS